MLSILYCFSVTDNNFSCCSSKWPVVTINCILATVRWKEGSKDNLPMEKHHFDVHVLSILVQKVFQEVRDGLVCYVSANDDVSNAEIQLWRTVRAGGRGNENRSRNSIFFRSTGALIDDDSPFEWMTTTTGRRKREKEIRIRSRQLFVGSIKKLFQPIYRRCSRNNYAIVRMHHYRFCMQLWRRRNQMDVKGFKSKGFFFLWRRTQKALKCELKRFSLWSSLMSIISVFIFGREKWVINKCFKVIYSLLPFR